MSCWAGGHVFRGAGNGSQTVILPTRLCECGQLTYQDNVGKKRALHEVMDWVREQRITELEARVAELEAGR